MTDKYARTLKPGTRVVFNENWSSSWIGYTGVTVENFSRIQRKLMALFPCSASIVNFNHPHATAVPASQGTDYGYLETDYLSVGVD